MTGCGVIPIKYWPIRPILLNDPVYYTIIVPLASKITAPTVLPKNLVSIGCSHLLIIFIFNRYVPLELFKITNYFKITKFAI